MGAIGVGVVEICVRGFESGSEEYCWTKQRICLDVSLVVGSKAKLLMS